MTTLDDLLDRLEIRRMETAEYRARWCTRCLRTEIRNPFAMLHPGGDGCCKQQMQTGTIRECIESFRALKCEST